MRAEHSVLGMPVIVVQSKLVEGLSLSVIVSTAVSGVPSSMPVGLLRLMMDVSSFSNWLSSLMFIVKVLSAESPFAQFKVPVVAV